MKTFPQLVRVKRDTLLPSGQMSVRPIGKEVGKTCTPPITPANWVVFCNSRRKKKKDSREASTVPDLPIWSTGDERARRARPAPQVVKCGKEGLNRRFVPDNLQARERLEPVVQRDLLKERGE